MIVSVTVLGSSDGSSPADVGRRVVYYLEGGRVAAAGRLPGRLVELPAPSGGVVAYYADSAGLRPPRWLGARAGPVDPEALASIVAGIDPDTGEPLISAQGSAGRAQRLGRRPLSNADLDRDVYSAAEAASVLGVSASYLRRVLRRETDAGGEAADGIRREGDVWQVDRAALVRLSALRRAPRVVSGYDLTFSVPKSVSVLWAGGDEQMRSAVLDALDESVAAGLRYLERHAIAVRVRGRSTPATGWVAADYLHVTSRALEPQLHHHVVLANAALGSDGVRRALDGRLLFLHAKASAHLAAAELRHQLTARLGVTWTAAEGATAEIVGIPEAARAEMSSRRAEIEAATAALGLTSARARQVAALQTRAAKDHAVDERALFAMWDARLAKAGYGPAERAAVTGRVDAPALLIEEDRARLFDRLVRVDGLTEHEAVFDRRAVVERLADAAGDRLSGDAIDAAVDELLARRELVELHQSRQVARQASSRDAIRRDDGRVVKVPGERLFTTEAMLALERRALDAYTRGRDAGVGIVPVDVRDAVLAEERFARLSEEQRLFVTALTGSGMRVQAGIGAAGSGKTTALEAAVASWQGAGYRVIGAAVGGTQAVVLAEETGVEARTVASLLAAYHAHGDTEAIDARTVILVDEASLVSTSDFAGLAAIAEERGATLRFVGDPAQHSAVRAGGIFRHLAEEHPADTPTLTHLYRQQGEEMAEVRLANAEFRERRFTEALDRLRRDGRITEAESPDEAYDLLVSAWYFDRVERAEDPARRRSAMTAEHHSERRELNARARVLLESDGLLTGPELNVAGLSFRAGDEVIARIPERTLRPEGAPRDGYVRNGSLGTVVEVIERGLVVDFERVGRVEVPMDYLERRLSPGVVGGLQHAYCLTTHAAQGETFGTAAPLITDASSAEGVYVGITRGQFDLQAVAIRRRDLVVPEREDRGMPVLEDETGALRATERRLERSSPEVLASELRPIKARVMESQRPSDTDLVESARRIARALRSARGDIERLEGDLALRHRLVEANPDLAARFERADDHARRRVSGLRGTVGHLEPALQEAESELRARGVEPPILDVKGRVSPQRIDNTVEVGTEELSVVHAAGPIASL